MMAIFGWLVLVVIGLQLSMAWFFLGWLGSMGKWTIGGAVNSIGTRITAAIAGLLIALYWYWLYTVCPFTITIN
jgi:hypothetical protein